MIASNPDFVRLVTGENNELVTREEDFKPFAIYIPEGDCLEFIYSPEPCFGERIDDLVTVYVGKSSGEVVGSMIKGVRRFYRNILAKCPGFVIEIEDGPVKLVHLFRAHAWTQKPSAGKTESEMHVIRSYRRLIEIAENSDTSIPDDLLLTSV